MHNNTLDAYVFGWFGLWYFTPSSTIFQLNRGGQFYLWGKPEETTDVSKVTDKLYHIMLLFFLIVLLFINVH